MNVFKETSTGVSARSFSPKPGPGTRTVIVAERATVPDQNLSPFPRPGLYSVRGTKRAAVVAHRPKPGPGVRTVK